MREETTSTESRQLSDSDLCMQRSPRSVCRHHEIPGSDDARSAWIFEPSAASGMPGSRSHAPDSPARPAPECRTIFGCSERAGLLSHSPSAIALPAAGGNRPESDSPYGRQDRHAPSNPPAVSAMVQESSGRRTAAVSSRYGWNETTDVIRQHRSEPERRRGCGTECSRPSMEIRLPDRDHIPALTLSASVAGAQYGPHQSVMNGNTHTFLDRNAETEFIIFCQKTNARERIL